MSRRGLVLESKVSVPALRTPLVERPRLLKLLDGDIARRLTAVTGPPGAGKTTILSQWLHGRIGGPVAWVSLDDGDNEPSRCWLHLDAAITKAGVPALPDASRRPPAGSVKGIRRLLDRVQAAGGELILVLDNVHLISERRVADGLAYFVKNQPVGCQTVMASRSDPPFMLSHLRASGSLLELRERDLRFSLEEISELLSLARVSLSDDDLRRLEEKTEGWAAGLQLAILSVRGGQNAHEFVERFAGTATVVADFLVGEVLDHLSPDAREFLLCTSILDEPSASLCDFLLGRDDSAAVLKSLEGANMLLVAVDDEQERYRYHHLFRDLLRAEIHWRHPDRERSLHLRAADWFEAEGDISSAIDQALAGGRPDRAIAFVGEHDAYDQDPGLVRGWLSKIPDSAAGESASNMVVLAQASRAAGLVEEAGVWLRSAERHLPAESEDTGLLAQLLALVAWWHAWRGQPEVALGAAARARALPPPDAVRAFDRLDRLDVRMNCFLERFEDARQAERRLERADPDVEVVAGNLAVSSRRAFGEGSLSEAESLAESALSRAAEVGLADRPTVLDARLTLAELKLERNLLDHAADELENVAHLARDARWMGPLFLAELGLARVDASRGHGREAIEKLNALVRLAGEHDLSKAFVRQAMRTEAEVWLRLGERRRPETLSADLPYQPENRVVMARAELAKGRRDAARLLVADDTGWTPRTRLARSLIHVRCLTDAESAREHARQALHFAMQEGYFRTVLEHGEDTLVLLSELDLPEAQLQFVEALLAVSRAQPMHDEGAHELSEREAVVLQCLPTHLSNQEIAAQLYVSPNTLKTHLRNIYRKLGVSSRREAVARAGALGLLPAPYESSVRDGGPS